MRKYFFLFMVVFLFLLPLVDLRVEPVFARVIECDPKIPGDCPVVGAPCPGACDALAAASV
ncbi:hypothetical protein M1545_00425, partial [Patescibacteria group bacterium]|nr:hypothetical protein [Patescibacteria group bacterium]